MQTSFARRPNKLRGVIVEQKEDDCKKMIAACEEICDNYWWIDVTGDVILEALQDAYKAGYAHGNQHGSSADGDPDNAEGV